MAGVIEAETRANLTSRSQDLFMVLRLAANEEKCSLFLLLGVSTWCFTYLLLAQEFNLFERENK